MEPFCPFIYFLTGLSKIWVVKKEYHIKSPVLFEDGDMDDLKMTIRMFTRRYLGIGFYTESYVHGTV